MNMNSYVVSFVQCTLHDHTKLALTTNNQIRRKGEIVTAANNVTLKCCDSDSRQINTIVCVMKSVLFRKRSIYRVYGCAISTNCVRANRKIWTKEMWRKRMSTCATIKKIYRLNVPALPPAVWNWKADLPEFVLKFNKSQDKRILYLTVVPIGRALIQHNGQHNTDQRWRQTYFFVVARSRLFTFPSALNSGFWPLPVVFLTCI